MAFKKNLELMELSVHFSHQEASTLTHLDTSIVRAAVVEYVQ